MTNSCLSETDNILEAIKESFLRNFSYPTKLKVFGLLSFTLNDEEENFLKVNINYKNEQTDNSQKEAELRSTSPPLLPPAVISPQKVPEAPVVKVEDNERKDRRKSRKPQRKPLPKDSISDPEESIDAKRCKLEPNSESKEEMDKNQPLNLENKSRVSEENNRQPSPIRECPPNASSSFTNNPQIGFTNNNGDIVATIPQNLLTSYLQNQNLTNCLQASQLNAAALNMSRSAIVSQSINLSPTPTTSNANQSQMVTLIGTLNNNTFTPIQQTKTSPVISVKSPNANTVNQTQRITLINGSDSNLQNSIDLKTIHAAINAQNLSQAPQNPNGPILLSCMRQPTGELNFQIQPNRIAIQSLGTFNSRQHNGNILGTVETPLALVTGNQKIFEQKKENIPTNSISTPVCISTPMNNTSTNHTVSMKPLRPDFRKFKIREDPTETAIGKILETIKGSSSGMIGDNKIAISPQKTSIISITSSMNGKQALPKLPLQPVTNNIRTRDNSQLNSNGQSNSDSHKAYKCHFCTKTFNRKFCRERHERLHTGIKPYSCDVCNEKFIRLEDKKRHVRGYSHYATNLTAKLPSSSPTTSLMTDQQSTSSIEQSDQNQIDVKEEEEAQILRIIAKEKERQEDNDEGTQCSSEDEEQYGEPSEEEKNSEEEPKKPQKRSQRLMKKRDSSEDNKASLGTYPHRRRSALKHSSQPVKIQSE